MLAVRGKRKQINVAQRVSEPVNMEPGEEYFNWKIGSKSLLTLPPYLLTVLRNRLTVKGEVYSATPTIYGFGFQYCPVIHFVVKKFLLEVGETPEFPFDFYEVVHKEGNKSNILPKNLKL